MPSLQSAAETITLSAVPAATASSAAMSAVVPALSPPAKSAVLTSSLVASAPDTRFAQSRSL